MLIDLNPSWENSVTYAHIKQQQKEKEERNEIDNLSNLQKVE